MDSLAGSLRQDEGKQFQTKGEKIEIGYNELFSNKGGGVLAQAAQRGSECPIPEDTQDQAGWGCEHLIDCRRFEPDGL